MSAVSLVEIHALIAVSPLGPNPLIEASRSEIHAWIAVSRLGLNPLIAVSRVDLNLLLAVSRLEIRLSRGSESFETKPIDSSVSFADKSID